MVESEARSWILDWVENSHSEDFSWKVSAKSFDEMNIPACNSQVLYTINQLLKYSN